MANPLIHALVFIAAVLIPGGLLVYFAWRAISLKGKANHTAQNPGKEDIPDTLGTTPAIARASYECMFPTDSPDSRRARSRRDQLNRAKAFRRRISKN
jgi:hypothetical protein